MGLLDALRSLLGGGDGRDGSGDPDQGDGAGVGDPASHVGGAGGDVAGESGDATGASSATPGPTGGTVADGDEPPADEAAAAGADTEMAAEAAELAGYWSAFGLDFTPESLARLDDLVDEQWEKARFRDVEFGDEDDMDGLVYTALARQLGSYYGEVLVRALDAEWVRREEFGTAVEVRGPAGVDADTADADTADADTADADTADADTADAGEHADAADEGDSAVVDVFHVAEDCLTEPSKFAASFDTVVGTLDLGADPVGGGTHEVLRVSPDDVDPAQVDADDGTGDEPAGPPTTAAGDDVVEHYRGRAADLVAEWPDYRLDYSVESLVRLDELVAAHYDRADGERASGGERAHGGDPLDVDERALRMPSDGSPMTFGGYFAELLRRHHAAEWRVRDGDELLVVEGPEGTAVLEPVVVAAACFAGESSFVDAYAHVAADVGLSPPV